MKASILNINNYKLNPHINSGIIVIIYFFNILD